MLTELSIFLMYLGYASNCRVSREEEEKTLEKEIIGLEAELKRHAPLEKLEDEYLQLKSEISFLKQEMNIEDDSDDSDDVPKFEPGSIKSEDIKSESDTDDDESSSEEERSANHSQH